MTGIAQDLFNSSGEIRIFLAARLGHEASEIDPLQGNPRKIIDAFREANGEPELAKARKAIRDYRKAVNDSP